MKVRVADSRGTVITLAPKESCLPPSKPLGNPPTSSHCCWLAMTCFGSWDTCKLDATIGLKKCVCIKACPVLPLFGTLKLPCGGSWAHPAEDERQHGARRACPAEPHALVSPVTARPSRPVELPAQYRNQLSQPWAEELPS